MDVPIAGYLCVDCRWEKITVVASAKRVLPVCKEVMSDSPGLVDFAIGLGNSVLNLHDGQMNFFWEIHITEEL